MAHLQLRVYVDPGAAEIFCNVLRKDGNYEKLTAALDTGAAVSLLPDDLLEWVNYRLSPVGNISIDQAGIAKQSFSAIEGFVTITLEDQTGTITQPFEARVWFAKTNKALIGFADILDHAILHIDMLHRSGWIEIGE